MDISSENKDFVLDSIKQTAELRIAFHRIHAIYCERIDSSKLPIYDSKGLKPYKIDESSYLNTIIAMVKELDELENV